MRLASCSNVCTLPGGAQNSMYSWLGEKDNWEYLGPIYVLPYVQALVLAAVVVQTNYYAAVIAGTPAYFGSFWVFPFVVKLEAASTPSFNFSTSIGLWHHC